MLEGLPEVVGTHLEITWADGLWAFSFASIPSTSDQLLKAAQRRGEGCSPCWGQFLLNQGRSKEDIIVGIHTWIGQKTLDFNIASLTIQLNTN